MTARMLLLGAAQLAAVGVVGWIAGDLLISWLDRRGRAEWIGGAERALLSVAGFCLVSIALMVAHIVLGGAVFGTTWVVPAALGALVAGRLTRAEPPSRPRPVPALLFGAGLVVLFVVPVVVGGPGTRLGDPPLHMGWTEELLAGEPVPSGPAPEFGRNAYPWGFHALLATMVRVVPGSDPLIAHESLHVVLAAAIPLAAACLARRVYPRAGWAAAAAAAFVGGFGWIVARGRAFSTSPRDAGFGADLVVASPNSVYELFPPALPREVGLVLLGTAGVLAARAFGLGSRRLGLAAGIVLGVAGLVSVPMLIAGFVWIAAAALTARPPERSRVVLPLGAAAGAVVLLWAAPVIAAYVRFGGFVDVTPRLGVEWPLPAALASWGLLLPMAIAGMVVATRSGDRQGRAVMSFVAGTIVFFGLTVARAAFDWSVGGNQTLLHQGRVWPVAHLLGAALAGIAAQRGFEWLAARRRGAAVAIATGVLLVGAASPALASLELRDVLSEGEVATGWVYGNPDMEAGSFVRRAAGLLGPDDVVLVEESRALALFLFQFSGARLAVYDDPQLSRNDLRIRYRDLAAAWDERMAGRGFDPDYVVRRTADASGALVTGEFRGETYVLVRVSS